MKESEYLELPWSVEDTIENLKYIKKIMIAKARAVNLDGKAESDAKEISFDFNRAISALKEIQQYRALGTVEELREAMEKQKAKKPNRKVLKEDLHIGNVVFGAGTKTYWCPNCNSAITRSDKYCRWCGQAIDFSETQEWAEDALKQMKRGKLIMDKIVESMTQVNLTEIQMPMAVIYDNPEDYPGEYVCRIWEGKNCHPTNTVMKKKTVEEIREDIQTAGFTLRFPAAEGDDPTIVETWMR